MVNEASTDRKAAPKTKKRSPSGKRKLSPIVTSTNLSVPDRQLFQEIARKKHKTDAELLREIVHRWCVVERRAPGSQEEIKDDVLIELQKEALSGVSSILEKLGLLIQVTSGFGDLLNLTDVQLTRLTNLSNGQQNMSAQTFAAVWSIVELIQRYFVERMVAAGRLPSMDADVHQMVVETTDNMRAQGLQMMKSLLNDCGSTQPVLPILISPVDGE